MTAFPERAAVALVFREVGCMHRDERIEAAKANNSKPAAGGAFGLHITDDDYDLIEVRADEEVFKTFLYMVEVFKWQEQQSKSVLLGPLRMGGTEAERALRAELA